MEIKINFLIMTIIFIFLSSCKENLNDDLLTNTKIYNKNIEKVLFKKYLGNENYECNGNEVKKFINIFNNGTTTLSKEVQEHIQWRINNPHIHVYFIYPKFSFRFHYKNNSITNWNVFIGTDKLVKLVSINKKDVYLNSQDSEKLLKLIKEIEKNNLRRSPVSP